MNFDNLLGGYGSRIIPQQLNIKGIGTIDPMEIKRQLEIKAQQAKQAISGSVEKAQQGAKTISKEAQSALDKLYGKTFNGKTITKGSGVVSTRVPASVINGAKGATKVGAKMAPELISKVGLAGLGRLAGGALGGIGMADTFVNWNDRDAVQKTLGGIAPAVGYGLAGIGALGAIPTKGASAKLIPYGLGLAGVSGTGDILYSIGKQFKQGGGGQQTPVATTQSIEPVVPTENITSPSFEDLIPLTSSEVVQAQRNPIPVGSGSRQQPSGNLEQALKDYYQTGEFNLNGQTYSAQPQSATTNENIPIGINTPNQNPIGVNGLPSALDYNTIFNLLYPQGGTSNQQTTTSNNTTAMAPVGNTEYGVPPELRPKAEIDYTPTQEDSRLTQLYNNIENIINNYNSQPQRDYVRDAWIAKGLGMTPNQIFPTPQNEATRLSNLQTLLGNQIKLQQSIDEGKQREELVNNLSPIFGEPLAKYIASGKGTGSLLSDVLLRDQKLQDEASKRQFEVFKLGLESQKGMDLEAYKQMLAYNYGLGKIGAQSEANINQYKQTVGALSPKDYITMVNQNQQNQYNRELQASIRDNALRMALVRAEATNDNDLRYAVQLASSGMIEGDNLDLLLDYIGKRAGIPGLGGNGSNLGY